MQLRGLAVGTLDKYRRRVQRGLQSDGGSLLPVEVVSSRGHDAYSAGRDGVLVVESRSGRRIEVCCGFDGVNAGAPAGRIGQGVGGVPPSFLLSSFVIKSAAGLPAIHVRFEWLHDVLPSFPHAAGL